MSSEKYKLKVGDLVIRINQSRWPEEFGYMGRVYEIKSIWVVITLAHIAIVDVNSGKEFLRGASARNFDLYEGVLSIPEPLDDDII